MDTAPRRRDLLAAAAAAGVGLVTSRAHAVRRAPLHVGLASYSMRKQSLEEVIAFCQQAGLTDLSLKDVHLPLAASPEEHARVASRVAAAGIKLRGVGVITMKSADDVERAFGYARAAGTPLIVASPAPPLLDRVEALVKATGVRLAIHNHGPQDVDYAKPAETLARLARRDRGLGLCVDVGNALRAGADPVASIKAAGARLFDIHLKDLVRADDETPAVIGAGIVDIVGILRALVRQRFAGHVAIEYEAEPADPRARIRESLAYVRGVLAALG